MGELKTLKKVERKTRKILTVYKVHHPKADLLTYTMEQSPS
jgi:hypothetical protein